MSSKKSSSIRVPIVVALVAIAFVIGIMLPNEEYGIFQDTSDNLPESKDIIDTNPTLNEEFPNSEEPISESSISDKQEPEVEIISPTSEEPIYEILGKNIPPGYEFGNIHNNDLKSGMTGIFLENSMQKASIRFTSQYEGVIKEISLDFAPIVPRIIQVGIQEDDGLGNPTGKWFEDSFIINSTDNGLAMDTFNFEPGINLIKDKVYHIVLEPYESKEPFETMYLSTFHSNFPGRPLNLEDPDIYSDDPFINSLFYDGSIWIEKDRWPIFLLTYEDGKKDGQPYSLAAGWTIRESIRVGQTLIPASDYLVSKFGFVVGKVGNPSAPLFYEIKDSQNNILADGVFVEAKNLQRYKNWKEITLDEPILFSAGDLYRIILYSPIPRSDDIYQIYGHEFSFDKDLGYGSERHRLTISHDAGEKWAAWNDADTLFKITTAE